MSMKKIRILELFILLVALTLLDVAGHGFGLTSNLWLKMIVFLGSIVFLARRVHLIFKGFELVSFNYILIFSLFMISGSLYSHFALENVLANTYLSRGSGIIFFLLGFIYALDPRSISYGKIPELFCLVSLAMLAALSVFMMGIYPSSHTQYYHEASFMLAVPAFLIYQKKIWLAILFCMAPVLTMKATGNICALLALALILFLYGKDKFIKLLQLPKFIKLMVILPLVLMLLIVVVILFDMFIQMRLQHMADVRVYTYMLRFEEIMQSPFVGSLFTGDVNIAFGDLYIPSHSDFLDILSGGGLFGAVFFLVIIMSLFRTLTSESNSTLVMICAFILMSCLITMAFNPILVKESTAFIFWFTLGVTLASVSLAKFESQGSS